MLWLVEKNQRGREILLFRGSKYLILIGFILLAASGSFPGTGGKINGKVTDAMTGEGVPGVKVIIIGTGWRTVTDTTGWYEFNNVLPGFYTIQVTLDSNRTTTASGVRSIQDLTTRQDFKLSASEIHEDIRTDLLMEKKPKQGLPNKKETGRIAGKVTDANNGEGLPCANVKIIGTKLGTQTDLAGKYYINVYTGTYVLRAEMLGFKSSEMIEVRVVQGKTTVKDFNLKAESTLPDH
jgi:hypothetical protein